MAVLAAAQLLDELMGRNRNVAPNEKVKELNWEETEYCKFFMVKFCPHDLFVNTRADLGPCSKTHDEEIRKLFQEAKKTYNRKLQYQEDFLRFCLSMIGEVDRKIVKGKQRLALSGKNALIAANPAQMEKNQEKINILNERINDLEKEAEQAGTDGNVEQAQGLMKLCDQLKEERDNMKKQVEIGHWNATAQLAVEQEKQMEVCEVCGAFLIVGDAQQRIDDHLMGKQHMGYMKLKKAVEEVNAIVKEVKEGRKGGGLDKEENRRDRDKEREKERENRREREREREKQREKEREEKNRSELREKEREKERREREKERERRRAEERERRERETQRERDREPRDTELVRESKLRERERERERERKHRSDREASRHHHHHHSYRHRR